MNLVQSTAGLLVRGVFTSLGVILCVFLFLMLFVGGTGFAQTHSVQLQPEHSGFKASVISEQSTRSVPSKVTSNGSPTAPLSDQPVGGIELGFFQVLPISNETVYLVGQTTTGQPMEGVRLNHTGKHTVQVIFERATLPASLVKRLNEGDPAVMMQPLAAKQTLEAWAPSAVRSSSGIQISSPSLKSVQWFDSPEAFTQAALSALSTYQPLTPRDQQRPASCSKTHPLIGKGLKAFEADDQERAAAYLNILYRSGNCGGQPFYQLVAAQNMANDDWFNALLVYRDGAQRYPKSMGLAYATLLVSLEQTQKALEVLNQLSEIRQSLPDSQQLHVAYMRGTLLAQQGMAEQRLKATEPQRQPSETFVQAQQELDRAAYLSGGHPTVLYNQAVLADFQKHSDQARAIYQSILPALSEPQQSQVQDRLRWLEKTHINRSILLVQ